MTVKTDDINQALSPYPVKDGRSKMALRPDKIYHTYIVAYINIWNSYGDKNAYKSK